VRGVTFVVALIGAGVTVIDAQAPMTFEAASIKPRPAGPTPPRGWMRLAGRYFLTSKNRLLQQTEQSQVSHHSSRCWIEESPGRLR